MKRLSTPLATAAAVALLAGCAYNAPATDPGPPPQRSAPPAPPPRPLPPPPAPAPAPAPVVAPTAVGLLETILRRVAGDSGVQISRTPTGALLLRATGDNAFDTGKSEPNANFRSFLQTLAQALATQPLLSARVTGHTDSTGDATLNDRLSEARAKSTVAALVGLGVAQDRLLAEGRGSREPIAGNDTAEGRASNRRVDLLVIEVPR